MEAEPPPRRAHASSHLQRCRLGGGARSRAAVPWPFHRRSSWSSHPQPVLPTAQRTAHHATPSKAPSCCQGHATRVQARPFHRHHDLVSGVVKLVRPPSRSAEVTATPSAACTSAGSRHPPPVRPFQLSQALDGPLPTAHALRAVTAATAAMPPARPGWTSVSTRSFPVRIRVLVLRLPRCHRPRAAPTRGHAVQESGDGGICFQEVPFQRMISVCRRCCPLPGAAGRPCRHPGARRRRPTPPVPRSASERPPSSPMAVIPPATAPAAAGLPEPARTRSALAHATTAISPLRRPSSPSNPAGLPAASPRLELPVPARLGSVS